MLFGTARICCTQREQPNAAAEQQNNESPDGRVVCRFKIWSLKDEMHQLDDILEQKIEPCEGEQLFRLIFLREKALAR